MPQRRAHARPGAELAGVGQTVPQAPQLVAVVVVFTSQPLAGLPSQFAGARGADHPQTPAVQRAMAPPPATHALPQAPQLAVSVERAVSQPLAGCRRSRRSPRRRCRRAGARGAARRCRWRRCSGCRSRRSWRRRCGVHAGAGAADSSPCRRRCRRRRSWRRRLVLTQAEPQQVEPGAAGAGGRAPRDAHVARQMVPDGAVAVGGAAHAGMRGGVADRAARAVAGVAAARHARLDAQ
jgi:hypothetical protein